MDTFISDTLERYQSNPLYLLQILNHVQDRFDCVSPEMQKQIAYQLGIPHTRVNAVVHFYSFLHESSSGQYDILFSNNIIDQMLGKQPLMDKLCKLLQVEPGRTRADGCVRIDNTSCTGMGDQGPAMLVNGYAVTQLDDDRIESIARLVENQVPLDAWPREYFSVQIHIRRAGMLLKRDLDNGAALAAVLRRGTDATLEDLKRARLRGLGGAGFLTAIKWSLCRNVPAEQRYVVCNADEGEPGTFKDRILLQDYADLVFEGMTVCALVIGARQGLLYLRGEYRYLLEALENTLATRRKAGLLGRSILGIEDFDFNIEIQLGAGAYICGEESALIESLEGKRGIPRIRPPFPVSHGYRSKPTVVDNVETLCAAAKIALRGSDCFTRYGTPESRGTKLISVSGDCSRPGVYEYPFGVRIQDILADCGANDIQAVQVAGPAGHCIHPNEFNRQIAFEDLPTGGSFMVFDKRRDLLQVVRNFTQFFAHESCGFCTPCRVGTALLRDLVDKVCAGHGTQLDLAEMQNISNVMQDASHCGLGHTATLTLMDTLKKYPQAWEQRLRHVGFEPAFDLESALQEAREISGREDPGAHVI